MSKWLSHLIFFVIVLGTASFAFYQYKQNQIKEQVNQKQNLLFSKYKAIDIHDIYLQQKDTNIHLVYNKADSLWRLKNPIQDIANIHTVQKWIQTLLSSKGKPLKKNNEDWSEYGLKNDFQLIKLTTSNGKMLQVSISKYSAFDGSFFLRRNNQLLLGNTEWAQLVNKSSEDFRSYKLINAQKHPLSLQYISKKFNTLLTWDKHTWKASINYPVSQSETQSYWSSLLSMKFEKDNIIPNTLDNQKKYGLLQPDIELKVIFPNGYKWSVKISSQINKLIYVWPSTRDFIFTFTPEGADKILLTEMKLRDHSKPFEINPAKVHFIELQTKASQYSLKKNNQKWKATKEIKINTNEMNHIVKFVASFSSQEYHGNKKFASLSFITLKDDKEKLLLNLKFSKPVRNKKGEEIVYFSSSAGIETMSMSLDSWKIIFSNKILNIENIKKPTSKKDKAL